MVSNVEIIDFVTSRIAQDLDFLVTHGFISRDDEAAIRSRLPAGPQNQRNSSLTMPGVSTNIPSPFGAPSPSGNLGMPVMPNPGGAQSLTSPTFPLKNVHSPNLAPSAAESNQARRNVPPPPPPRRPDFCRASWDYNADLSEPNDLMFRKGDVIEISEETNADWWTGICRGRTGLFPSNHVQRIPYDPHLFSTAPDGGTPPPEQAASQMGGSSATLYEKPRFPGQMAGGPGTMGPPMQPQQQGMPSFGATPQQQQDMNANPQDPQRKGKFGKVGGTLGNALVGGVGFGAGAAIGSGIIDAIF